MSETERLETLDADELTESSVVNVLLETNDPDVGAAAAAEGKEVKAGAADGNELMDDAAAAAAEGSEIADGAAAEGSELKDGAAGKSVTNAGAVEDVELDSAAAGTPIGCTLNGLIIMS